MSCSGVGVLGLAVLPAFWTGMPVVVGSAALLLGLSGRRIAALEGTTANSPLRRPF